MMKKGISLMLCVLLLLCSVGVTSGKEDIFVSASGGGDVVVGVKFHANSLTEFLWGLTRPVHLWNVENGKTSILPFWTKPLRPGGLLSWVRPSSWRENPSLTLGSLVGTVAIAAAASGGGGGGDVGGGDSAVVVETASSASGGGSSGGGGAPAGGGGDDGGGGGGDELPF
jgi:hypothetical protein